MSQAKGNNARPRAPESRGSMSGLKPTGSCSRFDPSVPHPARVYDYWLGGKDHYAADREAAEEVMQRRPEVVAGARANRAFLARVVRYLAAECGIRQFLDIGTGLPAPIAPIRSPRTSRRTAASSTPTTTRWCWCTRGRS